MPASRRRHLRRGWCAPRKLGRPWGERATAGSRLLGNLEQPRAQGVEIYRNPGTPTERDRISQLTRRETEILRLMGSGATNRALAERLHVSPATVRNHTHNIFEKLGVPNRLAAVTLALSQLLI